MKAPQTTLVLSTVSLAFIEDWLVALREICPSTQLSDFMEQTGLTTLANQKHGRVSHEQIVRLYQLAAVGTEDEMMGLWSRPIRSGALKHLCTSVRGASSLGAALFRFTTFWNLLLDDYKLQLEEEETTIRVLLVPRDPSPPQRFGHMLLLKLTHGIASWLVGRELPLHDISFAFDRPSFAEDYPVLFPAPIKFGRAFSAIGFDRSLMALSVSRSDSEMQDFLLRAPQDWIFTNYRKHTLALQVRDLVQLSSNMSYCLGDAAAALHLTPRTLMRRLDAEGTTFQGIKDGLRRDIALLLLKERQKNLEEISQDLGFASAANFHRAFKRWTGLTPSLYRQEHY